uniref:AlNc14C19G1945 protein n=1 Tax=Albugo laibachii Nc14 TaxID=890382 RepID=F0W4X4_9STRA|nr:AlNc14C19G1945 [Albugo laibachii Nc14]|eukprot:CCA16164.1 AlNc14C19G1945 [Albugo laibachii Nc14]
MIRLVEPLVGISSGIEWSEKATHRARTIVTRLQPQLNLLCHTTSQRCNKAHCVRSSSPNATRMVNCCFHHAHFMIQQHYYKKHKTRQQRLRQLQALHQHSLHLARLVLSVLFA